RQVILEEKRHDRQPRAAGDAENHEQHLPDTHREFALRNDETGSANKENVPQEKWPFGQLWFRQIAHGPWCTKRAAQVQALTFKPPRDRQITTRTVSEPKTLACAR